MDAPPDLCPVCSLDWHGLPRGCCPGQWGTAAQKANYRRHPHPPAVQLGRRYLKARALLAYYAETTSTPGTGNNQGV